MDRLLSVVRTAARAAALRSVVAAAAALALPAPAALAQGVVDPERGGRIEAVVIDVAGRDDAAAARIADRVRRALGIFPGDRYASERVAASLALARRGAGVAALEHEVEPGPPAASW